MMKIVSTKGCTAYGLSVDDKELSDLPEKEQEEVLNKIIKQLIKDFSVYSIIDKLTEEYGDYEYDSHICESCGDSISWSTLKIE